MNKLIRAVLLVLIILILGGLIGWYLGRQSEAEKSITDQTILTALHERGFLVTETIVSNVETTIKNNQSGIWQKLFWGQEINASGVAEVNLGVDLEKLAESDITIEDGQIIVQIPAAEIFNSRLVGDINVENSQGILKRFLENDDGYNQAMAELISQAESAATSTEMTAAANQKAREEIRRLVGYMAVDLDITVTTKE